MKAYIAGGIALGLGALSLVPHPRGHGVAAADPEIVATQKAKNLHFKRLDEISGIAIAGFRDEEGSPLLWGHNARVSGIALLRTRPSRSLYAGELTMPGARTRDAEDIATVAGDGKGKGTIYLEDAGSNRKDMPACVRYERRRDDPGRCSIAASYLVAAAGKGKKEQENPREKCLARGEDWFWLAETSRFDPGGHPAIRRIPEPTYQEVLRGKLAMDTAVIEFDYPRQCGARPCRTVPGNKLEQIDAAYNVESLAVVAEPNQSHTAYLFSKAPHSLGLTLKHQRPKAAACEFDSDGKSDVFRIRHLDTLAPGRLHQAEYVATLDLSRNIEAAGAEDGHDRITAANFMKLSDSQGLLLIRTTNGAYKWPVHLGGGDPAGASPAFDVVAALRQIEPTRARTPAAGKKAGISVSNQEAAAQLDEGTIYYMGECKGMRRCSVARVRDDHAYRAGDADGNGRIDKGDPAYLKRAIAGKVALYCKAAADADGDGRITPADVDFLDAHLARRGPAPALQDKQDGDPAGLSCGYYNPGALRASLGLRRGG